MVSALHLRNLESMTAQPSHRPVVRSWPHYLCETLCSLLHSHGLSPPCPDFVLCIPLQLMHSDVLFITFLSPPVREKLTCLVYGFAPNSVEKLTLRPQNPCLKKHLNVYYNGAFAGGVHRGGNVSGPSVPGSWVSGRPGQLTLRIRLTLSDCLFLV